MTRTEQSPTTRARPQMPRFRGSKRHRPAAWLIAVALLAIAPLATPALAQDAEPGRIVVSGEGRATAVPDEATISLAVAREAETASEALRATSEAMAEVLAAMREAGLEDRDLRTSEVSISPVYERDDGTRPGRTRPTIVGYVARNGLSVRVRDLDLLGTVLDRSVALGANEGGWLSFGNSDAEALRAEARVAAVRDAVDKAEAMAGAAGVELGRLVTLEEGGTATPRAPMMEARMMAADAAPVPIAAGESVIVQRVSATFEIGPPTGE